MNAQCLTVLSLLSQPGLHYKYPPANAEGLEESNKMGKTRNIFKKIRNTKVTFHAKMGSIKDINGMDLTEEEDIKRRWQEYKE